MNATRNTPTSPICAYEKCDRVHYAKGYCNPHWAQLRAGTPLKPIGWNLEKKYCSRESCTGKLKARGLCDKHYRRSMRESITEKCSFPDCRYLASRRGYCGGHYGQFLEGGKGSLREMAGSSLTAGMSNDERFDFYVNKTESCWVWIGAIKGGTGYGGFYADGKGHSAHRYSYERFVGKIPKGLVIDHMCHNRACVSPAHLQVVSQKLNAENLAGPSVISTTGVRGVFWDSRTSSFAVQVNENGKRYWGGRHSTIKEANKSAISLRNSVFTNNLIDRGLSR